MNQIVNYLIITIGVILIGLLYYNIRSNSYGNIEKKDIQLTETNYDELMHVLDDVINQTLEFRIALVHTLQRESGVIKYENELKTIVNSIVESLSPDIFNALEVFVSRGYVLSYITQRTEIFIVEQMKVMYQR